MHMVFRTMGQQAGLQLVRGVLPEAIDVYINDVIYEMTRQELLNGAKTVFQDNVNLQTTALGPINILRNLYRTKNIYLTPNATNNLGLNNGSSNYIDTNKNLFKWIKNYNADLGYYEIYLPTTTYNVKPTDDKQPYKDYSTFLKGMPYVDKPGVIINPMMYLGCSLQYNAKSVENVGGLSGTNPNIGSKGLGDHVGTRLIGGDTLETTFRDYCNGASIANPVVSLMSDELGREYVEVHTNTKGLIISTLTIKYIKLPETVRYDVDKANCVNCDLPDYIHYEIIRRAVAKFIATLVPTNSRNDNDNNN